MNKDPKFERAFPSLPHYQRDGNTQYFYEGAYGMTLRDYFAASALQALIAQHHRERSSMNIADDAYNYADSMLKVREGE
jgi:hypothetical protein